ncbi:uncharacterized protein [Watersipora subatra]|uniref:uncharacterized protein n=1 Tax=Watersipora subatra TaxID=2589382 RepID=UPI00355AE7CB
MMTSAEYGSTLNDELTKNQVLELFHITGMTLAGKQNVELPKTTYCIVQFVPTEESSILPTFFHIFAKPNQWGQYTAERLWPEMNDYLTSLKNEGDQPVGTLKVYTNYAPSGRCTRYWQKLQKDHKVRIDIRAVCPYRQCTEFMEVREMLRNDQITLRAFTPQDWADMPGLISQAPIPQPTDGVRCEHPKNDENRRFAADAKTEIAFSKLRPVEPL